MKNRNPLKLFHEKSSRSFPIDILDKKLEALLRLKTVSFFALAEESFNFNFTARNSLEGVQLFSISRTENLIDSFKQQKREPREQSFSCDEIFKSTL